MRVNPRLRAALIAIGAISLLSQTAAQTFSDPGFTSELVTTLPAFKPVGLTWAPDGRVFIWQKDGVVRILKNGTLLPTPFIDISSQVNTYVDRGALGLALHPDFASNGYVYMLFSREEGANPNDSGPKVSRLIRVTANPANPDVALPGSEVILLGSIGTPPCANYPTGSDCIPSDSNTHSIGTLRFGPDGKLLVGNGDGADAGGVDPRALRAQDLNTYSGKILRINDDGTAPGDNPFDDGTNSIRSKVWAYGLRNPYRFNLDPATGEIYLGDVGWNTWEEANHVHRGINYGWPCYEGFLPTVGYSTQLGDCGLLPPAAVDFPLVAWAHEDTSPALPGYDPSFLGSAAIGGPIYSGAVYPELYRGNFFYADYVGGWIRRLVIDHGHEIEANLVFATGLQGIVSLEQGPDDLLYYIVITSGQVRRIRFNGPVARITAAPTSGYSPLTVSFDGSGSLNPGGGALTYLWQFGDGQTSTLANPQHAYDATGVVTYTARLTVTDTAGKSSAATQAITVGSLPPTPAIAAPADGAGYSPGQVVAFQGSAVDPDETLGSSALHWTVLLHHNDHVHVMLEVDGATGSFVAQYHGVGTYSYELRLTATDSSGLASTTSIDLPVLPDTTSPSAPSGLSATPHGASRIDLSWSAASDNAGISGYHIERCVGASCSGFVEIAAPVGEVTSFSNTGLAAATTYRYRVRAADGSGNLGSYSSIAAAQTAAGNGLLAAYAFNEGQGGTAADASGNGITATIVGASWSPGKNGTAVEFNGAGQLGYLASSSVLDASIGLTIEAWVYPTVAQSDWRAIVQRETDSYFLHAGSGGTALRPAAGGKFGGALHYIVSPTAIPVGAWSHLACTWNGSTFRLYVNGAEVAAQSWTGTLQTTAGGAGPVRIGTNVPYGENFLGRVDDVRIYDVPRSAAEIVQDMNTPVTAVVDTTPPTDPTSLVANGASTSRIDLTWAASTDAGGSGLAGYRVERCEGIGCTGFAEIATPGTHAYSDSGLPAATTYRYRVRARDGADNASGYSNVASATTLPPDSIAPSVPGPLGVIPGASGQLLVSWGPSTDDFGGSGISGYELERCAGTGCTGFSPVATVTGTSFADGGLGPLATYAYRVRAVDNAGNSSGYTAAHEGTTTAAPTGPVAAYGFDEGAGATVGDASGNANTGTISGAAWNTTGKFGGSLTFSAASHVVVVPASASLDLSTGMTLEAWVYPTSAQTGWRAIIQRETDAFFLHASTDAGALRPAVGGTFGGALTYFGSPSAIPVDTWSHLAATWDGSVMRLYVNGTQVASQPQGGALQRTSTGAGSVRFGNNVPYGERFIGRIDEVRIYDRARTAGEIATDMVTPVVDSTPPTAPASLGATVNGQSEIDLSWSASTDTGGSGLAGYRVERCTGAGCIDFGEIQSVVANAHADTGLEAETTYRYRVRGRDGAGNLSGYSNVVEATTAAPPDTTPPSDPASLVSTPTSPTQIQLVWVASTDAGGSGLAGYRVERCLGAGCDDFLVMRWPLANTVTDTGLSAQTTYRYRVSAIDGAGNPSGYSNVVEATTPAWSASSPPSRPPKKPSR